MDHMDEQLQAVRPGRKRSEQSRAAILDASFELFTEVGYASLTIEGIAGQAGCGKQTIYRWWPSKADVLLESMLTKAITSIPLIELECYEAELRSFLEYSFALAGQPGVSNLLCALMAEAQTDAEFATRFRASFLDKRRDFLNLIINRGIERGDFPRSLSPAVVLDIVFGVIWYRMLTGRGPLDRRMVNDLTTVLARNV